MDEKTKFLDVLKSYKYFNSIIHICNECWNDDVFQAWKQLFDELIRRDIKSCIASHVILVRWYQIKMAIEDALMKYTKNPYLSAADIIERDKSFFLISSLCYALIEHLGKLSGIFGFVENEDFRKIISKMNDLYLNKLRQAMQHSILESYFFAHDNCEELRIIKKIFGNDTFNQLYQNLAEFSEGNKQIDTVNVEEMLKNEFDIISKNIIILLNKLKVEVSNRILRTTYPQNSDIFTSTILIPGAD